MMQKVEFIWISTTLGEVELHAHNWNEAIGALYDVGAVNIGKVKVVKRTYEVISEEPQIVNTNY